MKLDIVYWPSPILKTPATEVIKFDDRLSALIPKMFVKMGELGGIGLAAPQVGINQKILVYKILGNDGDEGYMINPKITFQSDDKQTILEGCLSFPNLQIPVERSTSIEVDYQDIDGEIQHGRFNNMIAQCIQHEIDHLNGITFMSQLSRTRQDLITRKLKKQKRNYERFIKMQAIRDSLPTR